MEKNILQNFNKPIYLSPKKMICVFFALLFLAGNFYFGIRIFYLNKELAETNKKIEVQQINAKTLNFTILFIERVLKSTGEVSFEERLELENAVRDMNDQEIFAQWKKFVNSKTEETAQKEVKNLLEILVKKIRI